MQTICKRYVFVVLENHRQRGNSALVKQKPKEKREETYRQREGRQGRSIVGQWRLWCWRSKQEGFEVEKNYWEFESRRLAEKRLGPDLQKFNSSNNLSIHASGIPKMGPPLKELQALHLEAAISFGIVVRKCNSKQNARTKRQIRKSRFSPFSSANYLLQTQPKDIQLGLDKNRSKLWTYGFVRFACYLIQSTVQKMINPKISILF